MMFKKLYPFKIPPTPTFSFYLVKKYTFIFVYINYFTHIFTIDSKIYTLKKSPHLKHEIGCKQN